MEPRRDAGRLAAMPNRASRALLLPTLLVTLAACGGATAPASTPAPAGTPRATPTAVPGNPGTGGGSGGSGSGGGSGSAPGTGGGGIVPLPGDPNQDPLFGDATVVTPAANLVNQHPINVQLVRAAQQADGTFRAELRWWSGVAPCNQLDHVDVARDDTARTIRFTVVEGSGRGDIACIEIAQLKVTVVDLGDLAPGTWTLSADGDAPAITVDVS